MATVDLRPRVARSAHAAATTLRFYDRMRVAQAGGFRPVAEIMDPHR
jgi:hypothetical protein